MWVTSTTLDAALKYRLEDGVVYSPATIVCIDKRSGKLIDYYFHSTDMRVCIHGLTAPESTA
jgi:hypothetical protein